MLHQTLAGHTLVTRQRPDRLLPYAAVFASSPTDRPTDRPTAKHLAGGYTDDGFTAQVLQPEHRNVMTCDDNDNDMMKVHVTTQTLRFGT